VELEAEQSERLRRNESEFRLQQKPSKRAVEESESRRRLLEVDLKYKLNSAGDFFYQDNYIKIDNTRLSAAEAAQKGVEAFGFTASATA
jgi:hypothetical protein